MLWPSALLDSLDGVAAALDEHDIAGLVELMSPDVEFTDPTGTSHGREPMGQRVVAQLEGFTDDHTARRSRNQN